MDMGSPGLGVASASSRMITCRDYNDRKRTYKLLSEILLQELELWTVEHDDILDGSTGLNPSQRRKRRRRMIRVAHGMTGRPWPGHKNRRFDWKPSALYNPVVPSFPTPSAEQQVLFRSSRHPLSNFFPCQLRLEGMVYRSSEHAYQCYKAKCVGDPKLLKSIYCARTGAQAKLLSKHLELKGESRTEWLQYRVAVMKRVLEIKYQQVEAFRHALNDTSKTFIEATGDDFWGCGLAAHIVGWTPRPQYPGSNVLGRLLTRLSRTKTLH